MMREFLLVILLLISHPVYSQLRDSVIVKNDVFEIIYSEKLEGPIRILYDVQCTKSVFSRKGLDFYTPDSIRTSNSEDYLNNIYDKGHMAPAADFNCDSFKLRKTFSYVNCSPQNQFLNRGVWRLLEEYERTLRMKYKKVSVEIIPKYTEKSIKLETGAVVPDGYTKIITSGKTIMKFYFPNSRPYSNDYMIYLVK